jgi:hypothetical protein
VALLFCIIQFTLASWSKVITKMVNHQDEKVRQLLWPAHDTIAELTMVVNEYDERGD